MPPDLAMSRFQAWLECAQSHTNDAEAGAGREIPVPAFGDMKANVGQDEVGDLAAEKKATEAIWTILKPARADPFSQKARISLVG